MSWPLSCLLTLRFYDWRSKQLENQQGLQQQKHKEDHPRASRLLRYASGFYLSSACPSIPPRHHSVPTRRSKSCQLGIGGFRCRLGLNESRLVPQFRSSVPAWRVVKMHMAEDVLLPCARSTPYLHVNNLDRRAPSRVPRRLCAGPLHKKLPSKVALLVPGAVFLLSAGLFPSWGWPWRMLPLVLVPCPPPF